MKKKAQRERSSKKAVLYARVSSKEQEREGYSIPSQLKLLRKYAEDKGMEVVAEHVEAESARKAGRKEFNKMIAHIRKHNSDVGAILAEKTDRLHRGIKDWATIDELMEELHIDIHLVKEGNIMSHDSNSSAKLAHGVDAVMSKRYIDNLSEEVRKGQKEKAEQGTYPGGLVPIGYMKRFNPAGKRVIVIDEDRAPLIKKIYELCATGKQSIKEIGKKARTYGLTYPKSGSIVPPSTVHKMLRNRFYTGEFMWGGKAYQGSHEPIIPMDLWQKVQDTLDGKNNRKHRHYKYDFAFSKFISCAECGCAVVGERKKGKYTLYHPTAWATRCKGEASLCKQSVSEPVLEKMFSYLFKKIHLDEAMLELGKEIWQAGRADRKKEHEEAIRKLNAEHKRIENLIDAAYEDKLEGKVTAELYDRKFKQWQESQARCKNDIKQHEKELKACMEDEDRTWKMLANPGLLFENCSPLQKRQLLNCIMSKCEWSDGNLYITLRKPFDLFFQKELAIANLVEKLLNDNDEERTTSPKLLIPTGRRPTKKEIGTREEFEVGRQKFINDLKEIAKKKPSDSPLHTIIPALDKFLRNARDAEFKQPA